MVQTFLSRAVWFAVLVLLQALVFNHVHILGYATPMPCLFFLLTLDSGTPRWVYVALGFVLGLTVDLFSNTPGMAASAMCLLGLVCPLVLKVFSPGDKKYGGADNNETFVPSHVTMEWGNFTRYVFACTVIYCVTFFLIESFSVFDWQMLLLNIVGSTLLTTLFVLAMELVRKSK